MTTISNALKKAQLIQEGIIYVPPDISQKLIFNKSSAGPHTNNPCITLQWDSHRVKLEVTKESTSLFSLHHYKNGYCIQKNQTPYLEDITIVPNLFHAPDQIFLNIEDRCIYNCGFCSLAKSIQPKHHLPLTTEHCIDLINKILEEKQFSSVALTSGVYPTNKEIIASMCAIIQRIKEKHPLISFGVEPCIFTYEEMQALKNAGADEIKINIQLPDENIFSKICPDFQYTKTLTLLEEAVALFGKGNVTSNIIYGMGETDASIEETLNYLSKMGVVPTLRKIRINNHNKKELEQRLHQELPPTTAERMIQLAKKQKAILKKYNLTTKTFHTMCHACGCCDIVPFCDI